MRIIYSFLALLLLVGPTTFAQKEITLESIYDGTFRQERLQSLRSLNNGDEYVVQNYDRAANTMTVDVYSYKTGEKTRTLINSAAIEGLQYFQGYELSNNETKALLSTNNEQIFRRSSRGIYLSLIHI